MRQARRCPRNGNRVISLQYATVHRMGRRKSGETPTREPGDRPQVIVKFCVRRARRWIALPQIRLDLSSAYRFILVASCARYLLTEGDRMSSLPGLLDHAAAQPRSTVWKDKLLPGLLAGGLALVLLYAGGFAETLHNAAHDSRHSASFPCH